MTVVGPVESGDCGALPDLSPAEQGPGGIESRAFAVKQWFCLLSPACGNRRAPVQNFHGDGLALGSILAGKVVSRFMPWFMRISIHRPNHQAELAEYPP
jgi:hypothetical protein